MRNPPGGGGWKRPAAPQTPGVRWRRLILITLAALAVLVLGLWLALPRIVAAIANRRLPQTIAGGVLSIERVAVGPPVTMPEVFLRVTAEDLLAWLVAMEVESPPRFVLRPGLRVEGVCRLEGETRSLALAVLLDPTADPPVLSLHLPAALINRVVRDEAILSDGELSWLYQFAPGSILTDADAPEPTADGVRRRFTVVASGTVQADLAGDRIETRVERLDASLVFELTRGADGYLLRGDSAVSRCDHQVVSCDSVVLRMAALNLAPTIELMLDEQLSAAGFEGVLLPSWFPTDLRVDLTLTE